ncbi:MAG: hypothetical protein AAFM92_07580 [Pseudomonadota bacterium]
MRALEPDWTKDRGGNRQVRATAQRLDLAEITHGQEIHERLWAKALAECVEYTSRYLGEAQVGFSGAQGTEARKARTFFFLLSGADRPALAPGDVSSMSRVDGAERQITTNRYQRDPELRRLAVLANKRQNGGRLRCVCCDLDFEERYGPVGTGFIHIHHLDPLGDRQEAHLVDPEKDLVAVCPNCHAMIHRDGLKSPQEIRELLASSGYFIRSRS